MSNILDIILYLKWLESCLKCRKLHFKELNWETTENMKKPDGSYVFANWEVALGRAFQSMDIATTLQSLRKTKTEENKDSINTFWLLRNYFAKTLQGATMLNSMWRDRMKEQKEQVYTYRDFCSLYDRGKYQECILAGIYLLSKKRRKEAGELSSQLSRAYFSWDLIKGDIERYKYLFNAVRRCILSDDDC